jgi:hypothetical protein
MRTTRHIFSDNREAQAFICGINWVNDSDVEVIDVEVGGATPDDMTATVIVNDEQDVNPDGPIEEQELDHREHV